MPLTHTKDLFAKALKGKYALGAFNVNNMELIQAIIEACEEEKAPVILQISKGARSYANPVYLKKLIEAAVSLSTSRSPFTSTTATPSNCARNASMKASPAS
jgi:fructose-bisphosphate aldolase class II